VSDLHVGPHEQAAATAQLRALVERTEPALIVATGDLTHRGRRAQHEQAAAFLRGLGKPVLAVPGNHDIPYTFPARFTHPWREFERQWRSAEPLYSAEGLYVVGVNSVRPWRHQSGGLGGDGLDRAVVRLAAAPSGALRVVCLHHQLANAPWRTRKRPLARRGHVLTQLAAAGAEVVLSGHVHQAAAGDRREFAVLDGEPSIVVVTAPGLTRPRPHRLGEAQGAHVVEADDSSITVQTYVFAEDGYELVAERRFGRLTR
jgi:3',5'-cyclic AMP phosphodiesterase CpdA